MPACFLQPLFTADTLSGRGTLTVHFTDNSIFDPEHPVTSWSWDFDGDGTEDSNEQDPAFTFVNDTGQLFTVSLTISNGSESKTIIRAGLVHIYPLVATNLAFWGKATCSSVESESLGPQNAIDENMNSRWGSSFHQPEWLEIEMDSVYVLGSVVIHWENAYGRSYILLSSLDEINWDTVYTETRGNGSEDILLFSPDTAKYIRLDCLTRATQYGFSIYELEICRSDGTIYLPVNNIIGHETGLKSAPNPFCDKTDISFELSVSALVQLDIFDIYGRKLTSLIDKRLEPGYYNIPWDNTNADRNGTEGGVYLCRLRLNYDGFRQENNIRLVAIQ